MFYIVSTCTGGGYLYCRTDPPHPKENAKGLYPLHRVLMENKLGRLLAPGEVVHHIDGDGNNNDPDNLEVMTRSEHARHHARRVPRVPLVCPACGLRFEMTPSAHRTRVRLGITEPCCSRQCANGRRGKSKGA